MVPSGFKRFVLLCFINQFLKNDICWPQQPLTEKVLKIQYHNSWLYPKKLFSNIKIKLNSNAWMIPKSSVVILQALKPLQAWWPQWPQQPQPPQWSWQSYFIKTFTDPDILIVPSTQMTNTSSFFLNGS